MKLQVAFSLAKGAKGCTQTTAARTCIEWVNVAAGKYTATILAYDKAPVNNVIPVGAKLLSQLVDTPFTIAPGRNVVSFALAGVVSSLTIFAIPRNGAGIKKATALSIQAKDPDGNIIVGPYDKPVGVKTSDTSGATSVATAGANNPPKGQLTESGDTATLNYSGLAIEPVAISASAKGVKSVSTAFAPKLNAIGPKSLTQGLDLNGIGNIPTIHRTHRLRQHSGDEPLVSFTAKETGWTNAPYNKTLTATLNGCSSVATIYPNVGTTFTLWVAASPATGTCTLTLRDGVGQSLVIPLGVALFNFSSSAQTFTVPAGITSITMTALGGGGGNGCVCGATGTVLGGGGGLNSATFAVAPGDVVSIRTGGKGGDGSTGGAGGTAGFNGGGIGGAAGSNQPGSSGGSGGGGGGETSVHINSTTVMVAGGGGGGGALCTYATGSGGGGADSYIGYAGTACNGTAAGQGATPTAGGTSGGYPNAGTSGQLGAGGAGGNGGCCNTKNGGGGGGGGGIYGGGGGAGGQSGTNAGGAGGGGGSGSVLVTATNQYGGAGSNAENGLVLIVW